ncbi:hypothetical protein TNCV_3154061 [Trichonephila clavipes]|nr:hypothetical protein TNCV_3154061 [Trichonephila clavipes]
MTTELAPSLLTTTPHQREEVELSTVSTCNGSSTQRVFSDTKLELMTRQPRVRDLDHFAAAATKKPRKVLPRPDGKVHKVGDKLVTNLKTLISDRFNKNGPLYATEC